MAAAIWDSCTEDAVVATVSAAVSFGSPFQYSLPLVLVELLFVPEFPVLVSADAPVLEALATSCEVLPASTVVSSMSFCERTIT